MEIFGFDYNVAICVLLFIAGALAGFVDSIVGGGGLISVPAMLLTNLPPSVALGSNKLSSVFGAASASLTYARHGMVQWDLVKKLAIFTIVGAVIGAFLVISIPPLYLKPIVIALLVGVTIFVVVKRDWGEVNTYTSMSRKVFATIAFFSLAIGLYDGFIGPGTGTFLIFMFITAGFDFLHASGNAKILNLLSNIVALSVFIYMDQVNYLYGFIAAAGQIIGANLGSRLAILKGSSLIRLVFLSTTTCMIAKLIYDYVTTHI